MTVGVGGNGAYGWNSIGLSGDGTEAQGVWCRDCDRLAEIYRQRARRAISGISPEAMACLLSYPFPGNVRELENEIERAVALANDGRPLRPEHLSDRIRHGATAAPALLTLNEAIERLKRQMIEDALRECGSKTRAAERLGLSRQSLQQMLRRRQS